MSTPKTAVTPTRDQDFAEWYQQVIKVADLAENSVVRGCMIMKPRGYAIWERIKQALDGKIKETGHENVYFPLLIPLDFLEKEAEHVEGFAKECAVVTHYRLESDGKGGLQPAPDAKLADPLIIRPTSETIIGSAMAKWIGSYNDLPLKLNQWANVMRWEMRTRLFLRTSEFLWQEGHTAHATAEEAMQETRQMLDVYADVVENMMAVPVIKGEKTASERFPGATNTYCIEAMMQDGKALQAGTSHFLGQKFSTAYGIQFTDENQQQQHAWTTSWGVSTRLIGALIMTHSDDDGLVLPPRVAPHQVIIIPMIMKEEQREKILDFCQQLASDLQTQHYADEAVRVKIDKSAGRGGEKFWQAVKQGTPIRIEVGMRDIDGDSFPLTRRDKAAKDKTILSRAALIAQVPATLEDIQQTLFQRAQRAQQARTQAVDNLEVLETLFTGKTPYQGFVQVYFDVACENDPKVMEKLKRLKLTARCIPFSEEESTGSCLFSGKKTSTQVIFARAY